MSSYSPINNFTGATDTIITGSTDKYLIFNSSGTVIFNNSVICDILLVGGGGGGGNAGQNEAGGGGGGGGVGIGKILFKPNITYTITIGNGGAINAVGGNTTIIGENINEIAYGGGYGSATTGGDGGSGGGGGGYIGSHYGGKATMGLSSSSNNVASILYYGNHGGWCAWTGNGSGGGGARNMGTDSRGNNNVSGGSGILWTINNSYYGGGGGAGGGYGTGGGAGGIGGGGNGGNSYGNIGGNAVNNTGGGGGGGASNWCAGGLGGKGILIIRYSMISNISDHNKTLRFSILRNSLNLSNEYKISNLKNRSPNNINNVIYLSYYLVSKTTQGLISLNPGKNALQIKNNTGVIAEGSYYIMCDNIPTLTYCLMDNKYNGGGWMMMMKATKTNTTFQYEANYWTTENTLSKTDLTRNNADAKYDSFNLVPIKDVMAIWPDPADFNASSGGSLTISDGWVWLVNNWYNNGGYVKALNGFQFPRNADPPNPYNFSGWKNGIFSTQSSDYRHIFGGHSHIGNGNNNWGTVRWGFIWNENGANNFDSCDVWNGIGVSRAFAAFGNTGKSAGDNYGCCGTLGAKANWTMRVELYGR